MAVAVFANAPNFVSNQDLAQAMGTDTKARGRGQPPALSQRLNDLRTAFEDLQHPASITSLRGFGVRVHSLGEAPHLSGEAITVHGVTLDPANRLLEYMGRQEPLSPGAARFGQRLFDKGEAPSTAAIGEAGSLGLAIRTYKRGLDRGLKALKAPITITGQKIYRLQLAGEIGVLARADIVGPPLRA